MLHDASSAAVEEALGKRIEASYAQNCGVEAFVYPGLLCE